MRLEERREKKKAAEKSLHLAVVKCSKAVHDRKKFKLKTTLGGGRRRGAGEEGGRDRNSEIKMIVRGQRSRALRSTATKYGKSVPSKRRTARESMLKRGGMGSRRGAPRVI